MADKTLEDMRQEATEKGRNIAKELTNALNSMSFDKQVVEGFVAEITGYTHRTLQQSTMKGLYALMVAWAKAGDEGRFDGRNERTVKFCQAVVKMAEQEKLDYFPMV